MKFITSAILIYFSVIASVFGGSIIMSLSDYETGNMAVYDIETGTLSDNVLAQYSDTYVKTDGKYLYTIEAKGADNISKYDMSDLAAGSHIYQYSVGENVNPHDMVFVDAKAYVILYGSPKILVVNPDASDEASFITGEIDISAWADADGSPEAHMGFVYDGMVYVVLQMYDLISYTNGEAVLLKIDPLTDTIVDMDDNTEGIQGIELVVKNPQMGSLLGSTLYLGGTTYGVSDEGVMTIDLTDPVNAQEKIISEADFGGNVAGIDIFNDTYGLIYTYDANWNKTAKSYNLQDNNVGDFLSTPDTGGGAVLVDGLLYVASRDFEKPGLYIISPFTDENPPMLEYYPTELPPYTIMYFDNMTQTEVAESEDVPVNFTVDAVYPNPFNPATTISFTMSEASDVNVDVFNISGQKVDTLVDTFMSAGVHALQWNAASLSTGIYYIRISVGVSAQTVKATLMK